MAIEVRELKIGEDQRELEVRGTPMFPCESYYNDLDHVATGSIPWHWHEEVELAIVSRGAMRVCLSGEEHILKEGEGIFINTNVLHAAFRADGGGCTIESFVFHPNLIGGAPESVFEQKYVRPLLNCHSLKEVLFSGDEEWRREAARCIREAVHAFNDADFGYEFLVREKLSHLWYLIAVHLREQIRERDDSESRDSVRIKEMLYFIHTNYSRQLDLSQIAMAASISERECLRCFQRTIGSSPVQYLLRYRLSAAARLLSETDESVTQICISTGFDSPSYFSKQFRRHMRLTPSAYRKSRLEGKI